MNTKHLLIALAITVSQYQGFSQAAVVDAGANKTLASQLVNTAKSLEQLERSAAMFKKAQEKIEKVNSYVSSISDAEEIISLQKEAIANVKLVMEKSKKKGQSRERMVKRFTTVLANITSHVTSVHKILTSGYFNMTDKERIDFFKEERSAVFILTSQTRGAALPYMTFND